VPKQPFLLGVCCFSSSRESEKDNIIKCVLSIPLFLGKAAANYSFLKHMVFWYTCLKFCNCIIWIGHSGYLMCFESRVYSSLPLRFD